VQLPTGPKHLDIARQPHRALTRPPADEVVGGAEVGFDAYRSRRQIDRAKLKRLVATAFDHTSIPRTVRKVFGIDEALSERERAAASFDELVTTSTVRRNDDEMPDLCEWLDRMSDAEPPRLAEPPPAGVAGTAHARHASSRVRRHADCRARLRCMARAGG